MNYESGPCLATSSLDDLTAFVAILAPFFPLKLANAYTFVYAMSRSIPDECHKSRCP